MERTDNGESEKGALDVKNASNGEKKEASEVQLFLSKTSENGTKSQDDTDTEVLEPTTLCQRIFPPGLGHELKMISKLAWPLCLTQLLQFLFSSVAVAFCGHLGKYELDGASLAASLINVMGLTVMLGLSSGCDTIFSQTYGSINKQKLGVALQRSFCILGLSLFPCWAIHINGEALLLALHQHPKVAHIAGSYLFIFIPGLFFYCLYMCLSKYLYTQNIVIPNLIIGAISNAVNATAHYVFLYVFDMGTDGSAFAQVLAYFTLFLLTLLYIIFSKAYTSTWQGWSLECMEEWGTFGRLSVFGLFMSLTEWLCFEIGIFVAGGCGTTELGAMSIVFQTCSLCFMIPFGVGIAASIRIGRFLGSGRPQNANTTSRAAFLVIWCVTSCISIGVASLRHYIPLAFTTVPEVVDMAASTLPALATFLLFDATNGVGCGILRGMGRQQLGTLFTSLTYGLALASGCPTMLYSPIGIIGYWWCLAGALFIQSCILLVFISRTDWENEVLKAQKRIKAAATETTVQDTEMKGAQDAASNPEDDKLMDNKDITTDQTSHTPSLRLILCRLLIVAGFVCVIVAGTCVRIFLPPPPFIPANVTNSTMDSNATIYHGFH